MPVTATANDTGISVKKAKPVLNLVRGLPVKEALDVLQFMPSPIAAQVAKLIRSASANAEDAMTYTTSEMRVVEIYANEGPRTKRFGARARGRGTRIVRRNSHITVVLDDEGEE